MADVFSSGCDSQSLGAAWRRARQEFVRMTFAACFAYSRSAIHASANGSTRCTRATRMEPVKTTATSLEWRLPAFGSYGERPRALPAASNRCRGLRSSIPAPEDGFPRELPTFSTRPGADKYEISTCGA